VVQTRRSLAVGGYFAMEKLKTFIAEWESDELFVRAHTSGSTGRPKEIKLLKADMRASSYATNTFFGINRNSVVCMALSVDYIAGKMMAVRALESGATLVDIAPSNDVRLPDSYGVIDLLAVVPSQLKSFISNAEYAGRVRNLLVGGAPPAADDLHVLALLGYKVWISYGMTETCSHVALARGDDSRRIFKAMPGISFDATDDGRLIVRAPRFSFKELVTNDVVSLIDASRFVWRGRADGIINSGGIKYVPEEIETLYVPFIDRQRFYVSWVPDAKWGQALALIVEGGESDIDAIAARLSAGLSDRRRLPKRIFTVSKLPEASNGKIRRLTPEELYLK